MFRVGARPPQGREIAGRSRQVRRGRRAPDGFVVHHTAVACALCPSRTGRWGEGRHVARQLLPEYVGGREKLMRRSPYPCQPAQRPMTWRPPANKCHGRCAHPLAHPIWRVLAVGAVSMRHRRRSDQDCSGTNRLQRSPQSPCQGEGRGFESRRPLQIKSWSAGLNVPLGGLWEGVGDGLASSAAAS
jgi:hypothetical protein